ncbi:hypothetical protein Hte_000247 [Hypoxylon texense]
MFMCHRDDDDSHVDHLSVLSYLVEVQKEMELTDEECFGRATAQHALGHITLEEYFDRLIDHIREGRARHTWDKSNSNISHVMEVDLIAGAFKFRMLRRNLGRVSHADGEQLKALCLLFYREASVAELQRRVELDIGVTLASLAPWIINILGIIAYARRHVDVLEYLVTNYRASSTRANTSFDLINANTISSRKVPTETFQHSPDSPRNRELEWQLWTSLLNAEPGAWLHYPLLETKSASGLPDGLYYGLCRLADSWADCHQLRASPELSEYLKALSARGVLLNAQTISRFLSVTEGSSINFSQGGPFVPVGAAPARTVLDCFPLSDVLSADGRPGGKSVDLALPVTQWPLDDPDRLAVMAMLLERGLAVDDRIGDGGGGPYGGRTEEQWQDTCLIQAAGRGDADMVGLLLRYGAQRDAKGAHGHTAAQRAREKGHVEIAGFLDGK